MRLFLLQIAVCVVLIVALLTVGGGCAANSPAGAHLADGAALPNGCLPEAIHAYGELTQAKVPAAVLVLSYRTGGQTYGHAMTTFAWRDPWLHVDRWAWDAQNRSQPIVSAIDDAAGVAAELFADPVSAHVQQKNGLPPYSAAP